jgi:carbon-monoxide dehydrogenase small subunit
MSQIPIRLMVNGKPIHSQTEARTSLGDFLRDELRHTGLHLACEHGVCGGCNVYINGDLSRSCTQLAMQCHGRQVQTIEGFEGDALMVRLRAAFSSEHALQCGYCTPGMLITAHDMVRRFSVLNEDIVRRELSGNLCRCTGYAGIVKAILGVAQERNDWRVVSKPILIPDYSESVEAIVLESAGSAVSRTSEADIPYSPIPDPTPLPTTASVNVITRAFYLPAEIEKTWHFFNDVTAVAACMPGFKVEQTQGDERLKGLFTIKLGPIRAAFTTIAKITRDEPCWAGRVESEGRDKLTHSMTLARLEYQLHPEVDEKRTKVCINTVFHIEGRLAEFNRPDVVAAIATQLTEQFASNVESYLVSGKAQTTVLELSVMRMLHTWLSQIRQRIVSGLSRFFRSH